MLPFLLKPFQWLLGVLCFFVISQNWVIAQQTLPGFIDEYYKGIWNPQQQSSEPLVGLTFDPLNRLMVWTKNGKVFTYVPQTNSWGLMLNISSETNASLDGGLLGFVLDPDFLTNGFIYVYYSTSVGSAAMGKLRRFKVSDPTAAAPSVDYNSSLNKTLIGESSSTGVPITILSHIGGTLVFGTDGSLIVSTGDCAYYSNDDNGSHPNTNYQAALNEGVMTPAENVGANRSQLLNSLSGKLLRIDPATGDGLPSNPYFNNSNPRSAQSRVWALGLRNPFRIMHVPLTGNHTDDPGDFIVGDVGQGDKEEFNLVTEGGQNFGWPRHEGMDVVHNRPMNYWPSNPVLPLIDYRTGAGRALKNGLIVPIGGNDVSGINPMEGNSAIAGTYYNKDTYPPEYKYSFFVGDASGIIYNIKMDANYDLQSVDRFAYGLHGSVVCMAVHPIEGTLYYVSHGVGAAVYRIRYAPGNRTPIARIKADTLANNSPVATAFTAVDSYDLDNEALTYEWNFGDGSPINTALAPHHVFSNAGITSYKVKLTVTDPNGAKDYDSVYVHVNNVAPVIQTSSIHTLNQIPANAPYPLTFSATATDDHTSPANLAYAWRIMLAHNDHEHLLTTEYGNNVATELPALDCELGHASYWYRIYLDITDAHGLKTVYSKDIFLNCGGTSQTITFDPISPKLTTDAPFTLTGSSTSGLPLSYYYFSGPASLGGNIVTLTGKPGYVTIRATQHGNGSFNQAPVVSQTFYVSRPITAQTVTFTAIGDQPLNAPPITLSASSSSGQPITYLLVSGPATLSGNVLTLTGQPGMVRVRAIQEGSYGLNGAFAEQIFRVGCPTSLSLSAAIPNGSVAQYKASQYIQATNAIGNATQILYQAGQYVELNPGFKTTTGAVFTVQIAGCN